MIISMRRCIAHDDLWPWHISSRSFSHDFAIKLLKYGTSCRVCFTAYILWIDFFHILVHMITSMRVWVLCNDLWSWPISPRSFSHDFPIKQLKYGTCSRVCYTASIDNNEWTGIMKNASTLMSMFYCLINAVTFLWSMIIWFHFFRWVKYYLVFCGRDVYINDIDLPSTLTHLGLKNMVDILQTALLNIFS